MNKLGTLTSGIALILLLAGATLADNSGRIYGKIHTIDGDTFEGLIRWDKNEGSWVDLLNGSRDRDDRERSSYRERARSRSSSRERYRSSRKSGRLRIFGVEITSDNDYIFIPSGTAESGVRFGHLRSLEVIDDDRALLTFKSGREVEFFNGSTDIGTDNREIVIEDMTEGEIEFSWDDIELIEFDDTDYDEKSTFGERLYGTLTTRRGNEFTGFVCWDVDELFENDILDGDEKRRSRKIRFGKIKSISRYSSSGAEVVLKDGTEMLLKGTNDVNDDNRGIIICDPGLGQVEVEWNEFEMLEFTAAPKAVTYSEFDGGHLMTGTVYTEDDEEFRGEICWDDDEEYTWEMLNGNYRDMKYSIEFGLIKEIEKASRRGCEVTVRDGRTFRLRGSNDVDNDNKGIIITESDGETVFVDFEDFVRVVFD